MNIYIIHTLSDKYKGYHCESDIGIFACRGSFEITLTVSLKQEYIRKAKNKAVHFSFIL